jgi:anti-sigma factor RsiW
VNPDKFFDYLDGRLLPTERAALEERLMSDKQLQRQLAVARQIHAGMHGDSREVVLPRPEDASEQGRKMAIRIGTAFMVLVFVNVGIGLWFIFRHESKNPNRALLERQMREQIAQSIERAAATLSPTPNALGVSKITVPAETGKVDAVANQVVAISSRLGGSATKGLQDHGRLTILIDVPANHEPEFRDAISSIQGSGSSESPASTKPPEPGSPIPATGEKKSFVVRIAEKQ